MSKFCIIWSKSAVLNKNKRFIMMTIDSLSDWIKNIKKKLERRKSIPLHKINLIFFKNATNFVLETKRSNKRQLY